MEQNEQKNLLANAADIKTMWSFNTLDDGTLEITGYKGVDKDIIIPYQIGEQFVSRIGDECFSSKKAGRRNSPKRATAEIRSVAIPGCVTSIGKEAFMYCENLRIVIIQEGLISVGDSAFSHCENLTDVFLPNSVSTIGRQAFAFCGNLLTITIPKNIDTIKQKTFWGCYSLENVMLPKGLKKIEKGAFELCRKLSYIVLPESLNTIEAWAFSDCKSLQNVTIPEKAYNIDDFAFAQCESMADNDGFVILKDTLLGYYGNSNSVIVPNGVNAIAAYAFYKRQHISSVYLPDGVESIGSHAFYGCEELRYIDIPDSVKHMDDWVFCNCKELRIVAIPKGIISIGDRMFSGCECLQRISIPDGVLQIGDQAFFDCKSLLSIYIPASVTRIGWAINMKENTTIHTPLGSYAEKYAKNEKIPVILENVAEKPKIITTPIDKLDFSVRTYNILKFANIKTLGELLRCTEGDLMKMRNMGKKSKTEIIKKLEDLGFVLRTEE